MALIKCPDCNREVSDAAAACIHCGRPLADARAMTTVRDSTVQGRNAPPIGMPHSQCPNCASTAIKKFSLLYEENRSTMSLNTVGGSYSQGGGFGISTHKTGGVQVTDLGRRVAPPEKAAIAATVPLEPASYAVVVGVIALAVVLFMVAGFIVMIIGVVLAIVIAAIATGPSNRAAEVEAKFEAAVRVWDSKFMCLQCGSTLVGNGSGAYSLPPRGAGGDIFDAQVDTMIRNGRNLEAIQSLVQKKKMSLADAKKAVDQRRTDPWF